MPDAIGQNVVNKKDDEGCNRHDGSDLRDELGQLVELDVERCFYRGALSRLLRHLANLGGVAHGGHHSCSTSVHHHGGTQDDVGRIGLVALLGGVDALGGQRLTRQARLVDLQVDSLHQLGVGGNLVAHLHEDDVAHHDLSSFHLRHTTIAPNLHPLVFVHGREHVEAPGGVALKIETHRCGDDHRQDDSEGLHEIPFDEGQQQRDERCHKKYLDDGVVVFVQVKLPIGSAARGCQHILAVLAATGFHLSVAQAL